ncbi:MAG: hypothetical protein AAFU49_22050 [Pseudomonadota bacterium]
MQDEQDLEGLKTALAAPRDRTPDGGRMPQFRWGTAPDGLWLFPASLSDTKGMTFMAAVSGWPVGRLDQPERMAFWVATAARQDLWRSLKGVPGLVPVIRVSIDEAAGHLRMLVGAMVPPQRVSPAVEAVLKDLIRPAKAEAWTNWARTKLTEAPGA